MFSRESTDLNLAVNVLDALLILLQAVGHNCHQVEMYLLRAVSANRRNLNNGAEITINQG